MLKHKRAQGLSINVIIIAVLGLVVLLVLIAIFSKTSGKSISVFEDCQARGGECRLVASGCLNGEIKMTAASCKEKSTICCIKVNE